MQNTELKSTPLFREHIKVGAKMAPFAGWNMPIQYAGILAEHIHTRSKASLFDTCHMGEFYINGDSDTSGMENIFSFRLKDMAEGRCRYGAMLNEKGGIIDDLVVYRLSKDEWMVVVNASCIERDAGHISSNLKGKAVFEDRSANLAKLDLQGPLSGNILAGLISPSIKNLRYYTFGYFDILGEKNIISRTGYTGELGYEVYVSSEKAVRLWELLTKNKDVKPAGLGARDTLRLEMAYPLYGQDVTEETTPLEAGMAGYVDMDKDFIGREALAAQKKGGIKRLLTAFKADSRRSPRHGYDIYKGSEHVGVVTSGSYSPSLSFGIGLGYVDARYAKNGQSLMIKSGPVEIEVVITERPFYKHGTARP